MSKDNHFKYINNEQHQSISMLTATMSDFTYAKHAHEEYSIGILSSGLNK